MSELQANDQFWLALDQLVASCKVVVDRPEGSTCINHWFVMLAAVPDTA